MNKYLFAFAVLFCLAFNNKPNAANKYNLELIYLDSIIQGDLFKHKHLDLEAFWHINAQYADLLADSHPLLNEAQNHFFASYPSINKMYTVKLSHSFKSIHDLLDNNSYFFRYIFEYVLKLGVNKYEICSQLYLITDRLFCVKVYGQEKNKYFVSRLGTDQIEIMEYTCQQSKPDYSVFKRLQKYNLKSITRLGHSFLRFGQNIKSIDQVCTEEFCSVFFKYVYFNEQPYYSITYDYANDEIVVATVQLKTDTYKYTLDLIQPNTVCISDGWSKEYSPQPPDIEEHPSDEAFMVVEEMPEFIGGAAALMEYIEKNLKHPPLSEVQGTVFVSFIVDKKGNIKEEKLLRGIDQECDMQALRLVRNMPRWKPGKQQGKAVNVRFNLPIKFIKAQ